jgi:hypothetical protein
MRPPGTVGNGLTILVIGRTRRLYNHCTPFLLSLAIGGEINVVDFVVGF